jgi:hypothetical protein
VRAVRDSSYPAPETLHDFQVLVAEPILSAPSPLRATPETAMRRNRHAAQPRQGTPQSLTPGQARPGRDTPNCQPPPVQEPHRPSGAGACWLCVPCGR